MNVKFVTKFFFEKYYCLAFGIKFNKKIKQEITFVFCFIELSFKNMIGHGENDKALIFSE